MIETDWKTSQRHRTMRVLAWMVFFCANLIAPLFFSVGLTWEHGRSGVLFAILSFLIATTALVARLSPLVTDCAIAGSVLLCLSQAIPLIQLVAGAVALEVCVVLGLIVGDGDIKSERLTSEFAGFAMTMITGSLLLGVNFVLSGLIYDLALWRRRRVAKLSKPAANFGDF